MNRCAFLCLLSSCLWFNVCAARADEGGTQVQVRVEAPQDGAILSGPSQVQVIGQARASRDYRPAQFDLMLILDTSGSTRAPAGLQTVGGFS